MHVCTVDSGLSGLIGKYIFRDKGTPDILQKYTKKTRKCNTYVSLFT